MFLHFDSPWCEGIQDANLLSEMWADVLLVLVASVALQLLLVGLPRLLQGEQGSGQQLFLVSLKLLSHHSQLCLGEAQPVPHTFMLHLEDQYGTEKAVFARGMGSSVLLIHISIEQKTSKASPKTPKMDMRNTCTRRTALPPTGQHCCIIHSDGHNWWHTNRNQHTPLHDIPSIITAAGPEGKLCVRSIPHFEWNSMELSTPDAWKEYLKKNIFRERSSWRPYLLNGGSNVFWVLGLRIFKINELVYQVLPHSWDCVLCAFVFKCIFQNKCKIDSNK